MVAEHRARADVDDDKQPDPLDFELVREAQWVGHDDLEPDVELVTIEFDDLIGAACRWRACLIIGARQAFEVRGAGRARSSTETA